MRYVVLLQFRTLVDASLGHSEVIFKTRRDLTNSLIPPDSVDYATDELVGGTIRE
jgi:hypothetical protein